MHNEKPTYSRHMSYDGKWYRCELFIDYSALMSMLERRANSSKRKTASLLHGAVKVKLVDVYK